MDQLTFVFYDTERRAQVERDGDAVVLRIGRRRLSFPVAAVPALLKMLAEAALVLCGSPSRHDRGLRVATTPSAHRIAG